MSKIRIEMEERTYRAYKDLEEKAEREGKNSFSYRLYYDIQKALEKLKRNPIAGEAISHKYWSNIYKKANLPNMFKINLIEGWRMWYYIKGNKIIVTCFVLGFDDHKGYEKKVYGK